VTFRRSGQAFALQVVNDRQDAEAATRRWIASERKSRRQRWFELYSKAIAPWSQVLACVRLGDASEAVLRDKRDGVRAAVPALPHRPVGSYDTAPGAMSLYTIDNSCVTGVVTKWYPLGPARLNSRITSASGSHASIAESNDCTAPVWQHQHIVRQHLAQAVVGRHPSIAPSSARPPWDGPGHANALFHSGNCSWPNRCSSLSHQSGDHWIASSLLIRQDKFGSFASGGPSRTTACLVF
jgi:hypothetical protein